MSAGLIALVARATSVPGEVRSDDRRVAERDVDLERWLLDEHVRLKRELRSIEGQLNARNLFHSGELGWQMGLAKERALQGYRDQESQARRDVAALGDREGWLHRAWRRSHWSHPLPSLRTPDKAQSVLDLWRLPTTRHLSRPDDPAVAKVDDPTARSLQQLLGRLDQERSSFN